MAVRSATLDPAVLVDALVNDIDGLRALQDEFGIRPYRLFGVTRQWDGAEVGDGGYQDLLEEFTPRPMVEPFMEMEASGLRGVLRPCGLDEAGIVRVSEVSLANTLGDLTGRDSAVDLAPGAERLMLLREGYGQRQPDRLFTIDRPPFPDRVKALGWTIWLRRVR